MARKINTVASLRASANPDVNTAPSAQDEDGDAPEVGSQNPSVNGGFEAEEDGEEDDSPAVHSVTVTHNGAQTDIIMRVSCPTGWHNKRLVLPGQHMTAKKLAALIANVKAW